VKVIVLFLRAHLLLISLTVCNVDVFLNDGTWEHIYSRTVENMEALKGRIMKNKHKN